MTANAALLDSIARRDAPEAFEIARAPACFEPGKGVRIDGHAHVAVSRSSIALRLTTDAPLSLPKVEYGETGGRLLAASGAWIAPRVSDAGAVASGERLFGAPELTVSNDGDASVAATRLVFAGASWSGSTQFDGRQIVFAPLANEIVSHHDARLSIAIGGEIGKDDLEAIERASSFVAGIDLELMRVEYFSASGDLVRVRHMRGYRRVGRNPHDPFAGVASEHRLRAWSAIASAIPRIGKTGAPIIVMLNFMASHNHVAEINSSAPFAVLTNLIAAHYGAHGLDVGEGAPSRRPEMAKLNRDLGLGLDDAGLDRFEKLRVELLEAGFFHAPGYETGRPQKDIKFLRDLAHVTILRLCGYAGPYYSSEANATREIPAR